MTACDLPPPVPVTALRVYEPLDAFAAGQRSALAVLAADPDAGRLAEGAERLASWRRVVGRPGPSVRGAADGGLPGGGLPGGREPVRGVRTGGLVHARVLRAEGAVLVAPVVVESVSRRGGIGAAGGPPDPERCHTLVRAWDIPMAWLSVVRSEDLSRSGGRGRYILPMSRARARAARALRTLRSGFGDVDVTQAVEDLARWLEEFHPRSWVELDARPVAALVDGEDGAEDVRLGLESLTAGDAAGVAAAYHRVTGRSHHLAQLSVSS